MILTETSHVFSNQVVLAYWLWKAYNPDARTEESGEMRESVFKRCVLVDPYDMDG